MGNDVKRTPGEWRVVRGRYTTSIRGADEGEQTLDDLIAYTYHEAHLANAAHIVKACNSHGALVAACEGAGKQLRRIAAAANTLPKKHAATIYRALDGWTEIDTALALEATDDAKAD